MRALGIDVSLRRGLDAVALDGARRLVLAAPSVPVAAIQSLIEEVDPAVVAVDSPPAWARLGRSRAVERRLLALGIGIFATPAEPAVRPFHAWMRTGFEVFAASARAGFPLYRGRRAVAHHALEVFPHASAVALLGRLPRPGERKRSFRRAALERAGVDSSRLSTLDLVDAALAALTGLHALEGRFTAIGDPDEVLVLPVKRLPERYRITGPA